MCHLVWHQYTYIEALGAQLLYMYVVRHVMADSSHNTEELL